MASFKPTYSVGHVYGQILHLITRKPRLNPQTRWERTSVDRGSIHLCRWSSYCKAIVLTAELLRKTIMSFCLLFLLA